MQERDTVCDHNTSFSFAVMPLREQMYRRAARRSRARRALQSGAESPDLDPKVYLVLREGVNGNRKGNRIKRKKAVGFQP